MRLHIQLRRAPVGRLPHARGVETPLHHLRLCRDGRSGTTARDARRTAPSSEQQVDKGLSLLELTTKLLPQSKLVSVVRPSCQFFWRLLVRELAPQSKADGSYVRPKYSFNGRIGSPEFPVSERPVQPDNASVRSERCCRPAHLQPPTSSNQALSSVDCLLCAVLHC